MRRTVQLALAWLLAWQATAGPALAGGVSLGPAPQIRYYMIDDCGSDHAVDRVEREERARVDTKIYVWTEHELVAIIDERFDQPVDRPESDPVASTVAERLLQFVEVRTGWAVGDALGRMVVTALEGYSVYSPYANIGRGLASFGGFAGVALTFAADAA